VFYCDEQGIGFDSYSFAEIAETLLVCLLALLSNVALIPRLHNEDAEWAYIYGINLLISDKKVCLLSFHLIISSLSAYV
jgi:hypothetical protein